MDIVITYVNGLDPVWQADYSKYTNEPVLEKRFRDWGTLKYLLRGIEVNIPFVRNVYLVVSHETQVPEWADTSHLKVVLHKDIIPTEYLPTFNSTTIEMFLHKIPGLDNEFVYFNDDTYPVVLCSHEDFFQDGKIRLGFTKHFLSLGMYKKQCRNSDNFARKALGQKATISFMRPQHICTPMLREQSETAYTSVEQDILPTLSRTRTEQNVNQYFFLDYLYYKGLVVNKKIPKKHFSVAISTPKQLSEFILNPTRQFVCINDVKLSESKYNEMNRAIIDAFEKRFPNISRFEKKQGAASK